MKRYASLLVAACVAWPVAGALAANGGESTRPKYFITDDSNPAAGQPGVQAPAIVAPPAQRPVVTITGPVSGATFPIETPIQLTGTFTDDAGETHVAQWGFDAATTAGVVNELSGSVSGTWSFSAPGVYAVRLTVTDEAGHATTATTVNGQDAVIVIFDQGAGFAGGSGRITSPAGALPVDPLHTGRADFSFDSKYHKLETVPRGTTQFELKWTDFVFQSTGYDWIVALPSGARISGSGTVGGTGGFGFVLWAVDGADVGGPDRFRIRIRNKATGEVVYDTQMGAPDTAEPTTALDSGDISVRLPNGGLGHLAARPAPAVEPAPQGFGFGFGLAQNSPNPFRASTLVRFSLPQRSHVKLAVFDVSGREIATLARGAWDAGSHSVTWTGTTDRGERARRGVYFVHLSSGLASGEQRLTSVRKMIVLD